MMTAEPDVMLWVRTTIAVVLLVGIAASAVGMMRIGHARAIAFAVARAAIQLALLSFVLSGVITDVRWVLLGLVVMLAAAIITAIHRARARSWHTIRAYAVAITAGTALAMLVVFATGALEFSARYLLAVGGIVIGNAMSISILTEKLSSQRTLDRWDEVEGWLALGATRWQSTRDIAREAIKTALIPSIDQTRTTGIVVMPGAFVGAVFAGASPFEAARFQLVVLAAILAAGAVAAVTLERMIGGVAQKPLPLAN